MATKKKKAATKKKSAPNKKATKPKISADEQHLLNLLAHTERAITSQGTGVDEFFTQQAVRIKRELEELRAKQCAT